MRGSRKIPMISLGGNTDLNVLTYRSVYRGFEPLLRKINNSRWRSKFADIISGDFNSTDRTTSGSPLTLMKYLDEIPSAGFLVDRCTNSGRFSSGAGSDQSRPVAGRRVLC